MFVATQRPRRRTCGDSDTNHQNGVDAKRGVTVSPGRTRVCGQWEIVMQQLTGMDASFLYFETPNAPGHIFRCGSTTSRARRAARSRSRGSSSTSGSACTCRGRSARGSCRSRSGLDHPYWIEDPDFDLEYHVRHIALPQPGDWRQLCIQVARLHSRPLDLNRPLWEMYVIEGLDNVEGLPEGSFAIMKKTHHAAVDGVTLLEIISAIHDRTPDAPPPKPKPTGSPSASRTRGSCCHGRRSTTPSKPLRMARLMASAIPGSRAADARAQSLPRPRRRRSAWCRPSSRAQPSPAAGRAR